MARKFQIKRGLKADMPTLAQGELGMTTDTGSEGLFIGTGTENIEFARKSDLDAIPTPDVSGQIGTHNSDSSAHSDIRESIMTHTGDTSIHVTAEEKATWNAKATITYVDQKISEIPTPDVSGQIGAHNRDSSAHSDIRTSITTHTGDASIHVTADQKTSWDAKATTTYVDQKISEIPTPDVSGQIGTHNTDSSAHNDIRTSITTHTSDTSIHVTAEEKATWNSKADAPFKPAGKSYLTFSSPNSFTLAVNDTTKHWNGTLEYFASDKTWTTWDGTTTLSSVDNDGEQVLYLRGTGNTRITGGNSNYKWVLTGSDIKCIGNIENLLDYATVESGAHPTMTTDCYSYMFADCTSLTQAPALPATTLAPYCYNSMFNGCTALTQAPALPAITLADSCYRFMFYGCSALTQAPDLPATTLTDYCYASMFSYCISLTQAPDLPATTLAKSCYLYMFNCCTRLTQAPALPATTLASSCYNNMFYGCTSLTQAPTLPATTLAENCYKSMFEGCTALTQAPALPATTLSNYCYYKMFQGCTSLKLSSSKTDEYTQEYRIPTTGTGTTASNALTDMFTSTGGTFTGTPEINTAYYLSSDNMVVHDTEIATLREYVGFISAPASHASDETVHVTAEEKATWNSKADAPFKPAGKSYLTFSSPNSFTLKVSDTTKHWDGTLEYFASDKTWTTWDGTTTLSSVDNDGEYILYLRGTGNTKMGYFDESMEEPAPWVIDGTNVRCNGNIETLLDYATVEAGQHPTMAVTCYSFMFYGCTALTQAPSLPATTLTDGCYYGMFYGCTGLTHAPSLPATTLATNCYYGLFYGCISLTQAPALPATTLATNCYSGLFYGCTSLTQAPALPATTLAPDCYNSMFYGCTSLTQAPALPATTLADRCYYTMFNGCAALTQAPVLPATKLADHCYQNMFYGCTSLTQAPVLPATKLADGCYQQMFQGCTGLTQAPALPATTLAAYCYDSMFYGCTSLTQAPALPATTLAIYCYGYMFYGCTSLKLSSTQTGEYTVAYRIPIAGRGTNAIDVLTDMFTSTGGTFTGTPEINTTYYLSSDNMVVRETEISTLNGYVGSMIDAAIGNVIGGSY